MRTRMGCVGLALVCVATPAAAQTPITEADALTRLSADSPRVRAIRAPIELARADVAAAGRWPNPRFTFNRESVAGVTENMFTMAQPLPVTGRRGLETNAATAVVQATERRADDALREARAQLRSAYADLAAAQIRETELATTRTRLRELSELLARREAAGEAAGYDRLRAEREVSDIENEWGNARADRARAQGVLAGFFAGATEVESLVVVPVPVLRTPVPGVDELVGHAEMVRGEMAALKHEMDAARFGERAADRRLVPEPEVVAGTKSSNVAGGDVGTVLTVHASIPLFDHADAERALARAQLSHAQARADAFRIQLRARIAALRAALIERRDAADRYRSASATAAQLERIAQASYDAGERGILELLDAYRTAATGRVRQALLDNAVRQAEIELELASGWEMK